MEQNGTRMLLLGVYVVEEGRTEEILKAPKADLTRRLTLASRDVRAYWDAKSL